MSHRKPPYSDADWQALHRPTMPSSHYEGVTQACYNPPMPSYAGPNFVPHPHYQQQQEQQQQQQQYQTSEIPGAHGRNVFADQYNPPPFQTDSYESEPPGFCRLKGGTWTAPVSNVQPETSLPQQHHQHHQQQQHQQQHQHQHQHQQQQAMWNVSTILPQVADEQQTMVDHQQSADNQAVEEENRGGLQPLSTQSLDQSAAFSPIAEPIEQNPSARSSASPAETHDEHQAPHPTTKRKADVLDDELHPAEKKYTDTQLADTPSPKPEITVDCYCKICDLTCSGPLNMRMHMSGTLHKKNEQKSATGAVILHKRTKRRHPYWIPTGQLIPSNHNQREMPIIGLDFVTRVVAPDKSNDTYDCNLCEKIDIQAVCIYAHLVGRTHRKAYLRKLKPDLSEQYDTVSVVYSETGSLQKRQTSDLNALLNSLIKMAAERDGPGELQIRLRNENNDDEEEDDDDEDDVDNDSRIIEEMRARINGTSGGAQPSGDAARGTRQDAASPTLNLETTFHSDRQATASHVTRSVAPSPPSARLLNTLPPPRIRSTSPRARARTRSRTDPSYPEEEILPPRVPQLLTRSVAQSQGVVTCHSPSPLPLDAPPSLVPTTTPPSPNEPPPPPNEPPLPPNVPPLPPNVPPLPPNVPPLPPNVPPLPPNVPPPPPNEPPPPLNEPPLQPNAPPPLPADEPPQGTTPSSDKHPPATTGKRLTDTPTSSKLTGASSLSLSLTDAELRRYCSDVFIAQEYRRRYSEPAAFTSTLGLTNESGDVSVEGIMHSLSKNMVNNDTDAAMAMKLVQALTQATLAYRLKAKEPLLQGKD